MKNLSRFDLGMIIAFAVVAILGGVGYWILSGDLQAAQADASTAAGDFDTYSKKQVFLPTAANVKTLQKNIEVLHGQLDPVVKNVLQTPDNKLGNIQSIDTVAWKRNLDDEVRGLNAEAKLRGIAVPNNFYYGFSRYLSTNPPEAATDVLARQQLAVSEMAKILIHAPVRGITGILRTYEEDPASTSTNFQGKTDPDQLPGNALRAPGGVYTAYPFEVDFDTTTDGFRKVVNDLMHSPYVFVIRGLTVQNSRLDSPKIADLDKLSGVGSVTDASVVNTSPGETAAQQATPAVGPQFLFGAELLHVRARIDLIDWHGVAADSAPSEKGTAKRR